MQINRVTVTGADNSVSYEQLIEVSQEYPFVEWGILVSSNPPRPRFPSAFWVKEMMDNRTPEMQFSCHVCGRWVREICKQGLVAEGLRNMMDLFQRVQLNFHAIVHEINEDKFLEALYQYQAKQFIFQLDDVNNAILNIARGNGINAVPLFDTSGGAGVLPEEWPEPDGYCGYAGGLSPDNLDEQLDLIEKAVGEGTIWIDAETHLRSDDDMAFDLEKVRSFLEKAKKYIE